MKTTKTYYLPLLILFFGIILTVNTSTVLEIPEINIQEKVEEAKETEIKSTVFSTHQTNKFSAGGKRLISSIGTALKTLSPSYFSKKNCCTLQQTIPFFQENLHLLFCSLKIHL